MTDLTAKDISDYKFDTSQYVVLNYGLARIGTKATHRANAQRSLALEMVAYTRLYSTDPVLLSWADDIEKRVWEAEGLK